MSDAPDPDQLRKLEQRIAAAKKAQEPEPKEQSKASQAQQAWRMIVELVVGIGIGVGIGYGLDVLFGTSPVFLVPFTFFGFAAGVNVMLKTARELQEENAADDAGTNEGK
ncbi:MAG TPA: F0F1 ATP synthase subunit I [Rhodobacteraceae bacterium]|nr:F0F1 ATP synthase subunit I [Paracoccaceae bacterium]